MILKIQFLNGTNFTVENVSSVESKYVDKGLAISYNNNKDISIKENVLEYKIYSNNGHLVESKCVK